MKPAILYIMLQGSIGVAGSQVITGTPSTSDAVMITQIICAMLGTISSAYFSYLIFINTKKQNNEKDNSNVGNDGNSK